MGSHQLSRYILRYYAHQYLSDTIFASKGVSYTKKVYFYFRAMKLGATLPYLQLDVSERGVEVSAAPENDNPRFETGPYAIDCVSYGVQVGHG